MSFLLFCVMLIFCDGSTPDCLTVSRDSLLNCFSVHIDSNQDGNITMGEVTAVLNVTAFFHICDINTDQVLNLYDWNHPLGCCCFRSCIYQVCETCINTFNWTNT